jgi:hypothetical protein
MVSEEVKEFFCNPNVLYRIDQQHNINVSIEPYDREIDTEYAEEMLELVKDFKSEILDWLNKFFARRDYLFVFSIAGHNIDGLYETNSLLIFPESQVYSNYEG